MYRKCNQIVLGSNDGKIIQPFYGVTYPYGARMVC